MKRIFNCMIILITLTAMSCKKDNEPSDIIFTAKCDFGTSKIEKYNKQKAILTYSNNINGVLVKDYVFWLKNDHTSAMAICNVPNDLIMEKEEKRKVIFSGRMQILSDKVDATSDFIELSFLKFE